MPLRTKLVNLEDGHPTVNQGLLRLERVLVAAGAEGLDTIKLIHGYGSSGVGGALRDEVWKVLDRFQRAGMIEAFIPGEEFRISNETTWALLKRWPELKQDRDLGRGNRGITMVVL
ncbi:MAG TPA: Smr/MutS family protein [candidate division Zixibacteria bacterium]|nr:Smr/MutS family protein [candidate division Zixibacteria bacterium]